MASHVAATVRVSRSVIGHRWPYASGSYGGLFTLGRLVGGGGGGGGSGLGVQQAGQSRASERRSGEARQKLNYSHPSLPWLFWVPFTSNLALPPPGEANGVLKGLWMDDDSETSADVHADSQTQLTEH